MLVRRTTNAAIDFGAAIISIRLEGTRFGLGRVYTAETNR